MSEYQPLTAYLVSTNVEENIGLEVHPHLDQFIHIEEVQGVVQMGDSKYYLDFQRNVYDDFKKPLWFIQRGFLRIKNSLTGESEVNHFKYIIII